VIVSLLIIVSGITEGYHEDKDQKIKKTIEANFSSVATVFPVAQPRERRKTGKARKKEQC